MHKTYKKLRSMYLHALGVTLAVSVALGTTAMIVALYDIFMICYRGNSLLLWLGFSFTTFLYLVIFGMIFKIFQAGYEYYRQERMNEEYKMARGSE